MSIDIYAGVREPHSLARILQRAEDYVSPVSHPLFVVLSPDVCASELRLEPFEVPVTVRDGKAYKESWTSWDRGTIEFGAGPLARGGVFMAYTARSDEMDINAEMVEMIRDSDADCGYQAVFEVHRTRGSFCLSLLVAAAIADLNQTRIQDPGGLLDRGEWLEPAAVVAIFDRHRPGVSSFEALIDAVFDELRSPQQWPRKRDEPAEQP